MMQRTSSFVRLLVRLVLPLVWFESVARIADQPGLESTIFRVLFLGGVLAAAMAGQPVCEGGRRWHLPWPGVMLVVTSLVAGGFYYVTQHTVAAWVLTLTGWVLALWLYDVLIVRRSRVIRVSIATALASITAGATVALALLESRFSEEEFFVALAGLSMAGGWMLTLRAYQGLSRLVITHHVDGEAVDLGALATWSARLRQGGLRLAIKRRWVAASLGLSVLVAMVGLVRAYQQSFFPVPPAPYPGISAEQPVLCGQIAPAEQTYTGQEVFAQMLALVEAHPQKGPPEYGMLALGSGDPAWIALFRTSLLAEMSEGRFTEPANSVKIGQWYAAQRVYYYVHMRDRYPELFSSEEDAAIQVWFAAINQRTLTVEWVDWLYALALAYWPAGPYENQENGAGLLALLAATGLGDPALAEAGQQYLDQRPRGWEGRTRNSDDTYYYQSEWVTNAYFQALRDGTIPAEEVRQSFEWLLLQMVPDGRPVSYNNPYPITREGALALGATLLNDPRYLWAAGRTAMSEARFFDFIVAQPGVNEALPLIAQSPTEGSCLIYGDTGTPIRVGPLAPDKIVFRDNWEQDATYIMLNLRFTGWHRYKATNTITLAYYQGDLIADQLEAHYVPWLPRGRSLLRDKRIPREHVSGLVVRQSGINAVQAVLSGIGSRWAQDPPFFAEVDQFTTDEQCTVSTTSLADWRGWDHHRTIRFCVGEPTLIVDEAQGARGDEAALMWNLATPGTHQAGRIRLTEHAELVLIPLDRAKIEYDGPQRIMVQSNGPTLRSVAVLLTGSWVGATVDPRPDNAATSVRITGTAGTLELPTFAKALVSP